MRELLIQKKHSSGLGGNFRKDKTFNVVSERICWSQMRKDVSNFVGASKVNYKGRIAMLEIMVIFGTWMY